MLTRFLHRPVEEKDIERPEVEPQFKLKTGLTGSASEVIVKETDWIIKNQNGKYSVMNDTDFKDLYIPE